MIPERHYTHLLVAAVMFSIGLILGSCGFIRDAAPFVRECVKNVDRC